jgi:uncharacterized membrane protein
MKKLEFIKELRSRLKGYPKDVVDNAVNYYSECIDDAVEDVMMGLVAIEDDVS